MVIQIFSPLGWAYSHIMTDFPRINLFLITCNGVCIVALKETFEQSFKLRTRAWLGLFRDNDGFPALFPSAECTAL